MNIRCVRKEDFARWMEMRATLWPDITAEDNAAETRELFATETMAAFVAEFDGELIGFLEANIRPYVDGCTTRNVGYIEGWYVEEAFRRRGIGVALVRAAENWARSRGCLEMGSDCYLDNKISFAAHLAAGYEEESRLIHFVKRL